MCIAKGQHAAGASNENGLYFLNTEVVAYRTTEGLNNDGDSVSDKKPQNLNDENLFRQLIESVL
jgi:hypothetical protein